MVAKLGKHGKRSGYAVEDIDPVLESGLDFVAEICLVGNSLRLGHVACSLCSYILAAVFRRTYAYPTFTSWGGLKTWQF